MNIPDDVSAAVRAALDANLSSLPDQIAAATAAVRALPGFSTHTGFLIDFAIQRIVHIERASLNKQIDTYANLPPRVTTGPAKVNVLGSEVGQRIAAQSLYNLMVGGSRLGDVLGADLESLQNNELALSAGHAEKAALLAWVRDQRVPADKRVRDVVPEKKLTSAFLRIQKRFREGGERAAS